MPAGSKLRPNEAKWLQDNCRGATPTTLARKVLLVCTNDSGSPSVRPPRSTLPEDLRKDFEAALSTGPLPEFRRPSSAGRSIRDDPYQAWMPSPVASAQFSPVRPRSASRLSHCAGGDGGTLACAIADDFRSTIQAKQQIARQALDAIGALPVDPCRVSKASPLAQLALQIEVEASASGRYAEAAAILLATNSKVDRATEDSSFKQEHASEDFSKPEPGFDALQRVLRVDEMSDFQDKSVKTRTLPLKDGERGTFDTDREVSIDTGHTRAANRRARKQCSSRSRRYRFASKVAVQGKSDSKILVPGISMGVQGTSMG